MYCGHHTDTADRLASKGKTNHPTVAHVGECRSILRSSFLPHLVNGNYLTESDRFSNTLFTKERFVRYMPIEAEPTH